MPTNGPIAAASLSWPAPQNEYYRTWISYDLVWEESDAEYLTAATYAGLSSGISASDTINSVSADVNVSRSGAQVNTSRAYLYAGGVNIASSAVNSTLINAPTTVSFSFSGVTAQNVIDGLTVLFECGTRSPYSGTGTMTANSVELTVDYTPSATAPAAFTFVDASGVELSTLTSSNTISLTGMTGSANATVTGGEMSINYGGWTSSATPVSNGDIIQVRATSSGSYSTAVDVVLDVYGTSDTFTITTRAEDTTPAAFAFGTATTMTPSALLTSDYALLTSFDNPQTISRTAGTGEISIGGGAWVTSGTVSPGDYVQARQTAPATPGTNTSTFTCGGVSGDFYAVLSSDTTPDAFSFTPEVGASTSTTYSSTLIAVAGVNDTCNVSFVTSGGTSHEYRKNGGAWTAVGATTAVLGDTFELRMVSPAAAASVGSITITIGGTSAAWTVSTGADVTPDAFTFTDVTGATPDTVYTSNAVNIAGMTGGVSATATITGGTATDPAQFKVNAGAYSTAAKAVTNGDTVTIQMRSDPVAGRAVSAVLTIDVVSDSYTVTNRQFVQAPDF